MSYQPAKLDGRIVALTGAGSGIGRALALNLAKKGCRLALADKDAETLAETSRLLGNAHHQATVLDVSDDAGVKAWIDGAAAEFGGLDAVINNAGLTVMGSFEDTPEADFDRVMAVNFDGVVSGCRHALPHMKGREAAWIVNVSSVFGIMGYPGQTAYNASKFAVRGLSEALHLEMQVSNPEIRVVRVHPGGIKTNVVRNGKSVGAMPVASAFDRAEEFEKNSPTTPEQAAQVIVDGMERGRHKVLIGPDARMIDLIVRLFPTTYFKQIGRFLSRQTKDVRATT